MLSTKIIMQSVQNFLTACGTILAYCSETMVSKRTKQAASVFLPPSVSAFWTGQGTLPSQFKKTTLEKWIFLHMLAKFYPVIFPVVLSSFSISSVFRSSSFVTIDITANIFHNSFRIYCKNAIYPQHFFCLFRCFQQQPGGAYQTSLQDRCMEVFCAQGCTFSLYTKKHAAEEEFSAACCTYIFCLSADLLQQSFQIAAAGLPGIGGSRQEWYNPLEYNWR